MNGDILTGAEKIKEARMLWSMTCTCDCDGCKAIDKLLRELSDDRTPVVEGSRHE